MISYPVQIECPEYRKKKVLRQLSKYGIVNCGETLCGTVDEKRCDEIREYCEKTHLKFHINNGFGTRGQGYRQKYFDNNPPHFLGKYYFCAYCGRLRSKKNITVDHLYPISKADTNVQMQKRLRKRGIRNINDADNLVAACASCNQKKGSKTGYWIRRGSIGRLPGVWYIRHAIRMALFCAVVYLIVSGKMTIIVERAIQYALQWIAAA